MVELLGTIGEFGARGYGHGFGWIFPLMFWLLILVGIFFLARRKHDWREWHGVRSGEAVLAERYAKGEISEEEYRQRKEVLREGRK
jgi:putative membrane protein